MWRIRSSVARSFSEYLDNSNMLTKPSSYSKPAHNQDRRKIQERRAKKKDNRFSFLAQSREKMSIMDVSH